MEMPKPAAEQRALEILVGTWLGQERLFPSSFDPIGGLAIGHVHNRLALDGFAVIQDYEQERDGAVNFRGHGLFRWDTARHDYVLHWFDSMGGPPTDYRGTLSARVLVLTAPQPQGFSRAIFDFSLAKRYHYRLEISPDGNQWMPFTEGEYVRQ
jgi:hypothetical protein